MTPTPSANDTLTGVPSDRLWLRSELMGTQVITRDSGRRLGVVGEVIVDIDRREVVAVGLRDNPLTRFLPGLPRWMPLDRIRQVGDVILVDSADSLSEGFNPERYSRVINCQVITESGDQLGRVLGFAFDIETGELSTLVMGALGVPLLGEGVLSTWEMPVEEIVSSGPDRIIVYEGAEDKLKQLNSGVLEKLGVGGPSWEEQERERYRVNLVPVENQLSSGQPVEQQQRQLQASEAQRFEAEEEMEYVELEDQRRDAQPQRRYLEEQTTDSFESPRYNTARYRDEPSFNAAPNEEPSVEELRFEEPRFEQPQIKEQRFDDSSLNDDPAPRRAMPASRRPVQKISEPLDVEPIRDDLDDPW
ncbi:PRC-barrel domain-containing protein [Synechococcus sp. BL107]|uniref:PRC-barrel domain-containing protein n=1 Tax=Synechococcus sp. BL107 TaxID=313625 RepID=UPI0002ED8D33|nr:PRC-barrel domain-containing protein [Synechococcus sp. BL107]